MSFLHLLENWRTPFGDTLFYLITQLGDEAVFIAAALFVFWCVDKRGGYFLLTVGFFGIVLNETVKLAFRVPRPWVLDPTLTPVQSALGRAVGYSFPSGHTQNAACLFGGSALIAKKKPIRLLCIAAVAAVAFSRMYLGVHTPLDVSVAVLLSGLLLLIFYLLFRKYGDNERFFIGVIAVMALCTAGFLAFAVLYVQSNPAFADNTSSTVTHGYYMLGGIIGLAVGYPIERRKIRFETDATVLGQIVKITLGFAAVMVIKSVLKEPLLLLFHGLPLAHAVRYAVTVLFALAVYPLTFRRFARLGAKK